MKQYLIPRYRLTLVRDGSTKYPTKTILCANDAAALAREVTKDSPNELMLAFWLDGANKLIGYEVCAQGGLSQIAIEPRQLFRGALMVNAQGVVFAHNHPSGDPTPSADDLRCFNRIKSVAELIGLTVLDSIVVSAETTEVGSCAG